MSPVPPPDSTADITGEAASGNGPAGELTLADLEREFGLACWEDDGQYYTRHPLTAAGDYDAKGDDPADLREAILLNFPETRH